MVILQLIKKFYISFPSGNFLSGIKTFIFDLRFIIFNS